MTAQLPLKFNGQLVGLDQLTGNNYVTGFPELMQLLVQHAQNPQFGYALPPCFVYPLPGKQRVYAIPGRSWFPGQRLRAYRFGNAGDWRTVMVHAYNQYTGEMQIEVLATSIWETDKTAASGYYFTPYFSEPIGAANVAIAAGGSGAGDIDTLRKNLQLPVNSNYQILFADFIAPNSFCREILNNVDYGPAAMSADQNVPHLDYQNHPGLQIMRQGVATNDVEICAFGRPFDKNYCDMSGDDSLFECEFYLPALSTSGGYRFEAGLIGPNAKLCLQYIDNLNTARFQYYSGVGASYTISNTTLTVAAATWYRFTISIVGSNVQFQINGANTITVAKAAFQGVTSTNRMTPMARYTIVNAAGVLTNPYLDYLYFRRHFTSGR